MKYLALKRQVSNTGVLIAILLSLLLSPSAFAVPPANDNFANSIAISGTNGQTTANNQDATQETGEPLSYGGFKTVWWSWTAPDNEEISFHTNGSDYDTVLAIYTGVSVDSLSLIGEDDDSGNGNKSIVTFTPVQGTVYHVQIAGREHRKGNIVLTWGDYVPFKNLFTDTEFTTGWLPSGQDSGPENPFDPTSPDDVNITTAPGVLQVITTASPENEGRQKIAGWYHDNVFSADSVGPDKWIRGKFYIYTNRPFEDNLNTVSNFRIRLQNEVAVTGGMNFDYAQTGGGAYYEPLYGMLNNSAIETSVGQYLRPSADGMKPSLYRANLDPVDVPALSGTKIWATFESYSFVAPSDCILSLTEFVAGTYAAQEPIDGALIFEYDRMLGSTSGVGGNKVVSYTGFNAEANIEAGRRQDVKLPGLDGADPYSSALVAYGSEQVGGQGGLLMETTPAPDDLFGVGVLQIYSDFITTDDNPRIALDKLYHARYYVTSSLPTTSADPNETIQGQINLRMQTAGTAATGYLYLNGPANAVNPENASKAIVQQTFPGIGTQNPAKVDALNTTGEDGGWYSVLMNSPWSSDIRRDGRDFGTFANEPNAGEVGLSMKDITFGADLVKLPRTVKLGPPPYHNAFIAQPNDVSIRISKIEVYEYPDIDDGGYGYEP